jgi:hypothetical protein
LISLGYVITNSKRSEDDSIKQIKQGLANLSEEDAKADKLRSLHLFV